MGRVRCETAVGSWRVAGADEAALASPASDTMTDARPKFRPIEPFLRCLECGEPLAWYQQRYHFRCFWQHVWEIVRPPHD